MKVLLFACIEKNIGDDLFIYTVCERYKNVDFYIDYNAKYGDLEKIKNLHFSKLLKYWNRVCNIDEQSRLKKVIKNISKFILSFLIGNNNVAIYIVGNAFKNMNYTGSNDMMWLIDRVTLTKEFYLLSTNFGPYNDKRWIKDCENIFKSLKDVCFRDTYSYGFFKDLDNVRYAPDTVLTLNTNKNREIKDTVIISMIDCSMDIRSQRLNNSVDIYEKNLKNIANHYLNKGYKVILMTSNYEQDYPSAKRIYDSIFDKDNISIFNYQGNFDDVLNIYSRTKYVIATRLHTLILSWIYHIPVLPIVYDIKVLNLLSSYNFNNRYLQIDEELNVNSLDDIMNKYNFECVDDIIKQANNQFINTDKLFLDKEDN